MKTVQDYMRELDKEKLISVYMSEHRGFYLENSGSNDMTAKDVEEALHDKLSDLIDVFRTIAITPPDDGKTAILLVHRMMADGSSEPTFSLVHADEVLEDIGTAESYCYMFQHRSEIAGYLVSDAPLTRRYIYNLMADVLHETSFNGFDEESQEEARHDLEERLEETEPEGGMTFEELQEVLVKDLDDYDRGVFLDELSKDEKELLERASEAQNEFYENSFRKELGFIRSELEGIGSMEQN